MINDDAALVQTYPYARTDARRDPRAKAKSPSVETDVGGDPHAKKKRTALQRKREPAISKPRRDDNVFTHFPKGLNCDVCQMTKTTRARCENMTSDTLP